MNIFVFGSNKAGRHGAGAALFAKEQRGAIYGQGEGLQGESYAIPTKDGRNRAVSLAHPSQTLPLSDIEAGIKRFLAFAESRPDLSFEVTPIGCGRAGYTPTQIAPFFLKSPANCILPEEFKKVLSEMVDKTK